MTNKRTREHAKMLEEALARPGVNEVMKVYGGWREKEKEFNVYRRAMEKTGRTTTTNSTSTG